MDLNKAAEEGKAIRQKQEDVEAEMKRLQIETMKLQLEEAAGKKAAKVARQKANESELAAGRAIEKRKQQLCNHRSGGKNREGLDHGTDNFYAVNTQTDIDGSPWVLCCRCQAEWHKGDPGWQEALAWPTRNEPATSYTFSNVTMPKRASA